MNIIRSFLYLIPVMLAFFYGLKTGLGEAVVLAMLAALIEYIALSVIAKNQDVSP